MLSVHTRVARLLLGLVAAMLLSGLPARASADTPAKVYVILWFDTEDYILPADDDASLHVAEFLTHEGIRATFKVVGEKARTLERRGRQDVIAALKKHEIGYHANFHSVQPTPAMYLSNLGWDEGVAEFDRRVYEAARAIPAGATLSYGELAARLGERALAREVGQALGRNPFPIIVPCHRVLAAGAKAGGFSANGGVATKLALLTIERARTSDAPTLFDEDPAFGFARKPKLRSRR